jgi:hypothetical protein
MKGKSRKTERPVPPSGEPAQTDRPDAEAIRLRAYERFCARGCLPGDPVTDWLEAERELIAEHRRPPTRPQERNARDGGRDNGKDRRAKARMPRPETGAGI